jgi:hypothetical protein
VNSSKIVRIVVWGAVLIAVVVVLYIRLSKNRLNQAISDGNASVDAGDAELKKITQDEESMLGGNIPQAYLLKPASGAEGSEQAFVDREKIKKPVTEADEIITKVVASFREAATKYEEGKKSSNDEVITHYFDLMSQAYQLRADAEDERRKAALLVLDKSIATRAELVKQQKVFLTKYRKAEGEFEKLDEQAAKLKEANKSKFN